MTDYVTRDAAETNRLHGLLNTWATTVAKERGVFEIPKGFESVAAPFAPILFDAWCSLPVAWGFELIRHTDNATGEMYEGAQMECIQRSPNFYGATWGFVLVSLSYSDAAELLGKPLREERGPLGGFKSITFGSDESPLRFLSKRLDPLPYAARQAAAAARYVAATAVDTKKSKEVQPPKNQKPAQIRTAQPRSQPAPTDLVVEFPRAEDIDWNAAPVRDALRKLARIMIDEARDEGKVWVTGQGFKPARPRRKR